MSKILLNFRNTMILSAILAVIMIIGFGMHSPAGFDQSFWIAVFRWFHVLSGILWIGLLYYFNFVQIRQMPKVPAELKPGVSKYIAPEALFWFRWAALSTVLAGIVLAWLRGYLPQVLSLGFYNPDGDGVATQFTLLGVGVYLALIMFINVWGVIWPNQKIALGIVEADADAKAKAATTATLFSRTNTLLSLPMLVSMTMYQTLFG